VEDVDHELQQQEQPQQQQQPDAALNPSVLPVHAVLNQSPVVRVVRHPTLGTLLHLTRHIGVMVSRARNPWQRFAKFIVGQLPRPSDPGMMQNFVAFLITSNTGVPVARVKYEAPAKSFKAYAFVWVPLRGAVDATTGLDLNELAVLALHRRVFCDVDRFYVADSVSAAGVLNTYAAAIQPGAGDHNSPCSRAAILRLPAEPVTLTRVSEDKANKHLFDHEAHPCCDCPSSRAVFRIGSELALQAVGDAGAGAYSAGADEQPLTLDLNGVHPQVVRRVQRNAAARWAHAVAAPQIVFAGGCRHCLA
jgi:hypothetical protein